MKVVVEAAAALGVSVATQQDGVHAKAHANRKCLNLWPALLFCKDGKLLNLGPSDCQFKTKIIPNKRF